MSKHNFQSTLIRSCQPNRYYWVAITLSLVEVVCLLFGDQVESQLGLIIPFRLLMFSALARCAEASSRAQFSNRASWLALPYIIASVLHYSMNSGEVPVFSQLYYLSAFISLPLFDVVLAQVRSSDSLAGVFEMVSFVALGVVSIIHIFCNDALVVFWESFLRSYLQAVFRLTQLTLSSSDVAAAVHAAANSMTGRVVISHILSPIMVAYIAILGAKSLRGDRDPWFDSWLSANMGWSTFWTSVFVLMSSYVTLLLNQYLGISLPGLVTNQFSGCYDLIRFIPCIFGLSYCHYQIFQRNQPSRVVFFTSLVVFSILGGMLYAPLAFVGLVDKAVGLRTPQVNRKPSVPRSTT